MLQRLGIRGKLLAVVAVPLIALLVALGAVVAGQVADYRVANNAEQLVSALDAARETERDLQAERWASVNFVDSLRMGQDSLASARTAVDEQLAAVQSELAAVRERRVVEESEDPDQIYTQASYDRDVAEADALWSAVSSTVSDSMLAELRGVNPIPATAAGEWVSFPAEADIVTMAEGYATAVERLDELSAGVSSSLNARTVVAVLSFALEVEATAAEKLVREPQEFKAELEELFPSVNEGLDAIRAAADQVPQNAENALALRAVEEGGELREQLPDLRAGVMAAATDGGTLLTYYTSILDKFVLANGQIAVAMPDRENVAGMQAYADIDQLVEYLEYEKAFTERIIRRGSFQGSEANTVRGVQERSRVALATAQSSAQGLGTDLEVPNLGASIDLSTTAGTSFESIRNRLYDGNAAAAATVANDGWPGKSDQEIAQYTPVATSLWEDIEQSVAANARSSVTNVIIAIIGAVVAVVAILLITFAIARRITVPLRRLTTTATAVREELPRLVERVAMPGEDVDVSEVQIAVDSQDEVGRLAEAFNGVNAATIEIAREQAALRSSISEMFVNVARRDQVLLNRQLSSIDEMERTEDDPSRLTKLFALDHLATRMRRNSESLLVLAGIDTGRRLRRAMPLSDVVRTASSEIELYERVDLDLVVDPSMLGHQALTAAHLFAELLENATVFSDPGSRVVVRTGRTVDGFTVEVIDTGIGMTPEELAEANARVQSSAASEILGAQRLGLFVVGRIARRLGAHVAITAQEGAGTVVTVLLPQVLFEAVGDAPEERTAPAVEAYTPAAVVPGAPLVDAPALAPETVSAPVAEPDVDDAPIPVPSLEDLIAADQAAAPAGAAVVGADLVDGTSSAGLPSRRKRREDEANAEDRNVIGLPVRATADQLSALDAEAASFTPSVPAAEVTPQSPEERSSMFRGFRSRKDAASAEPASEQPGQEAASALPSRRRDAVEVPDLEPIADDVIAEDAAVDEAVAEPGALDALVIDDAPEAVDAPIEAVDAPIEAVDAPIESVDASDEQPAPQIPTAAALGGAFAAFDAIRRASAAVNASETPAAPTAPEGAEDQAEPAEELAPAAPSFSMPKFAPVTQPAEAVVEPELEAEPETEPVLDAKPEPVLDAEPETVAEPELATEPEAFVVPELEPEPEFDDTLEPAQEVEPEGQIPALELEPDVDSAGEPEPTVPAESAFERSPYGAAFAARPEAPSVSEVEAPVAPESQVEPEEAPTPVAEVPAEEPAATPWMSDAEFAVRAAELEVEPVAPAPSQPLIDDIIAQASGEEAGRAGFFGRLFGRGRNDSEGQPAWSAPATPVAESPSFAPVSFEPGTPIEPSVPAFEPAPATFEPAPAAVEQAPVAQPESATETSFEPDLGGYSPAAPAFEPYTEPVRTPDAAPAYASSLPEATPAEATYSPEQLANPLGWEAAGESALAASFGAAPAVYEPMLDTQNSSGRAFADDDADMASAVFSELSSLSEQRPVVEKTKAGLQRRQRAPQAEVAPIADEVTLTPKDRDADAVRNRFSSFYSGTQRARTDVAELELRSTPEPAHE